MGRSMGNEADQTAVDGWYAPGVNLHRTAYTARNFEYYSEDGVLSGKLAAKVIYGAKTNGLTCFLKHFACSEPGPNPARLNTWLTEQNLRENYLKPFEIAVKEGGANAIMSAFNRVGASWAGANYALLTQVLRNEWGFKGTVITDWTQAGDDYGGMNVVQGVRAGNDLWLNPQSANETKLSTTNATDMACARRAAHNILYTIADTRATLLKAQGMDFGDLYQSSGSIAFNDDVFAWWKPVLYGVDAVVGVLFVVWFIVLFKPRAEETSAKNSAKKEPESK
jgi:beta-glucosidase